MDWLGLKTPEGKARRYLILGAFLSIGAIGYTASDPTSGAGVLMIVGWIYFLIGLHRFGRLGVLGAPKPLADGAKSK